MDPFLTLLLGLLAVLAIPGLVFFIADLISSTETHHINRHDFDTADHDAAQDAAQRVSTSTGRRS